MCSNVDRGCDRVQDVLRNIEREPQLRLESIPPLPDSTCTLPVGELVKLIKRATPAEAEIPSALSSFVLSEAIEGEAREDCVWFRCTFTVMLFQEQWTAINLLPDTVTLTSSRIRSSKPQADPRDATIAMVNGYYALMTKTTGQHEVVLEVMTPYTNKSNTGATLSFLPSSSRTSLSFTLLGKTDVAVTVEPSLETSVCTERGNTVVTGALPPLQQLAIRWTQKQVQVTEESAGSAAPASASVPLNVTVEQQHMFSVGEGMLLTDSTFLYDIRNGSLSAIDIRISQGLRILSVEGSHLKRWDVVHSQPLVRTQEEADKRDKDAPLGITLKVLLDQGVEGAYELSVTSEIELAGTSCTFTCPYFRHTQDEFSREKGFIALEAITNIELDQTGACAGAVAVDVEEVPQELRARASNPILLAYKYLYPKYNVPLSVKKHGDIDVLIAAVDAAHLTCTKTAEGRIMNELVMKVRNTQKQYMRIDIPRNCDIWSTIVSGNPVKPARDRETGSVMVPLQKSGGSSAAKHAAFNVEVVWVQATSDEAAGEPPLVMGDRGALHFQFPRIDIPLNIVLVSLYVPDDFKFSQFDGDLHETARFSQDPPTASKESSSHHAPMMMLSQMPRRGSMSSIAMSSNVMLDENPFYEDNAKVASIPFSKGKKAGIVPVRVKMVTSGRLFRFERLLVTNQVLSLRVTYKKTAPRWKRRTGSAIPCC